MTFTQEIYELKKYILREIEKLNITCLNLIKPARVMEYLRKTSEFYAYTFLRKLNFRHFLKFDFKSN